MLKKILLPTVVISGTLLASFGVLLATQGSKRIDIQLESNQVFYGELKDVVSPPVGALVSVGVALGVASVLGWQQSKNRKAELEKKVLQLQSQISNKDAQIQELKVAPSSPMLSKLEWFLDGDDNVTSSQDGQVVTRELLAQPATEPVVKPISGFDYQVITTNQPSPQNTVQNTVKSASSRVASTQQKI
jgi:hypothetical protein